MGKIEYPFIAGSPSKPESEWLGYPTMERAQEHADNMNARIQDWDSPNSWWDKKVWPVKPLPWIAKKVENV